jgi:hypothetical protein
VKYLAAFFIAALPVCAAIEGTVMNLTTGKPQPGVVVNVMNLSAGMNSAGAARTDAQGVFRVNAEMQSNAPYLVQAIHQGVTYNTMLQPGSPGTGITLEVYNASAKVPEAKVSQHMILLEPSANGLTVNQTFIYANSGKTTYHNADGTLRFQVPPEVTGPVQVRIMAPHGMPITREAEKAKEPNTYMIRYPVKPGETRFDAMYIVPGTPEKFAGKILHGGGPVRFVAPPGVTLEGSHLQSLGAEPQTGAQIYELKSTEYAVNIQGTGSLQASAASAPEAAPAEDPSGGINIVKPRIYQRTPWLIGLTVLMLGVGFVMLYRSEVPALDPRRHSGKPGKRA